MSDRAARLADLTSRAEYAARLAAAHAETRRINREYIKGTILGFAAFATMFALAVGVVFSH